MRTAPALSVSAFARKTQFVCGATRKPCATASLEHRARAPKQASACVSGHPRHSWWLTSSPARRLNRRPTQIARSLCRRGHRRPHPSGLGARMLRRDRRRAAKSGTPVAFRGSKTAWPSATRLRNSNMAGRALPRPGADTRSADGDDRWRGVPPEGARNAASAAPAAEALPRGCLRRGARPGPYEAIQCTQCGSAAQFSRHAFPVLLGSDGLCWDGCHCGVVTSQKCVEGGALPKRRRRRCRSRHSLTIWFLFCAAASCADPGLYVEALVKRVDGYIKAALPRKANDAGMVDERL